MIYKTSVLVPDALIAMETNLKAILAMFGVKVKRLTCSVSQHETTASIQHYDHGDGLCANVYFPVLTADTRLSRDELNRWTGYFIHEICHAIWTNERDWQTACREGLGALVNGMEDVRIEREMIKSAKVDNARDKLVDLLDWVSTRPAPKGAKAYNPNDMQSLPWTLAIIGRVKVNGYPIQAGDDAYRVLTKANRKLVDGALARLAKAKSTLDVLEIARSLKAMLSTGAPQAPSQAPGEGAGQPSPSRAGDEADDEAKASGEPSRAGDEPSDEPSEGENASEGDGGEVAPEHDHSPDCPANDGFGCECEGEGEGEGDNAGEGEGENTSDDSKGDGADGAGQPRPFDTSKMDEVVMNPVSDAVAKASRAVKADGMGDAHARFATILRDAVKSAEKPLKAASGYASRNGFARLASEAQKASSLRQQCARVLKRSDKDSWARRLSAGRVDRRAFGRLAAGDLSNPFAKHSFSPGYETELTIILDGSDSMNQGAKLERAASLALVVAQAAEQVGVKCELVRFYGGAVVSIKAPRERLASQAVRDRLDVAASGTSGSTPLTQSIALCAKRLLVRAPLKRKMIFCVTDGVCDCGRFSVREIAKHCDANGVEVIGLSIDSHVHGAFKFEAQVNSSDDVSKAGLGVLVKALENRPGYASAAR